MPNNYLKIKTGLTVPVAELVEQAAAPATPASGFGAIYEKTDGVLYFKGDDGVEHNLLASGSSANQYGAVVANPAISGFSGFTTIAAAIAATVADDVIYIAQGTYAETITLSSPRRFEGAGYGAKINGVWTFASGSSKTIMEGVNFLDNVVINAGVNGIFIATSYQANAKTITDNGTVNENYIVVHRET